MKYFEGHNIPLSGSIMGTTTEIAHTARFYGIQYNHSGEFYLRVGNGKRYVADGAYAFITHPDTYVEYGATSPEGRYHNFICSTGKRIEQYISGGLLVINDADPLIKIINPENFLHKMLEVISLSKRPGVLEPRAVLLYEELLLHIHESRQQEKKLLVHQELFLSDLIKTIRTNPEAEYDFNEYAHKCHVTPTHFRRIFKIVSGLPPGQFHIDCKLQKAAELLMNTNSLIADIAETVGIDSQFYFSRLFKKKFWLSPVEYRREFSVWAHNKDEL